MAEISFGRLADVALREAWAHEALGFTPWLAANIDHISEAIGVPLELTGTEVAVETFSADILARNPQDDSVVLIENQLEQTDHTHLGQIMTYLAGLNAKTVIWIAPRFREPHLSAIKWLNEHTADGFSFFALRLRVVRIGESPYAPIFDVIEKPSNWERRLSEKRREVTGSEPDPASLRATRFWARLINEYPELFALGVKAGRSTNLWIPAPIGGLVVGLYLASGTCGIYVRGTAGTAPDEVAALLHPHRELLETRTGVPLVSADSSSWFLIDKIAVPVTDEARWGEIMEWMALRLPRYLSALSELKVDPA